MSYHLCCANGCRFLIPTQHLMCMRHWMMVPRRIRAQVRLHYRHGQEVDKRPSDAYVAAMTYAIGAVAMREPFRGMQS